MRLGAITACLTRIKYVDLQKCYPVELGEALPWCCIPRLFLQRGRKAWRSFAQRAKAQQSCRFHASSRPTHWRRKLGPSLARQIKLGGFGSLSSGISDVSTSVSTAGAAVSLCAAFFNRLGFTLATVRFAALATLRALPRFADFPLGSFPRFCTFDAFLRLAMIAPLVPRNDTTVQVAASYRTRVINRSPA